VAGFGCPPNKPTAFNTGEGMPNRSIRSYIRFHAVLLIGVPVVSILLLSMFLLRNVVLEREMGKLEQHVIYQQLYVNEWLQSLRNDVAIIAGDPVVRAASVGGMRTYFSRYLDYHPDVAAAACVGPDGLSIVDTSAAGGIYLGDRAYFTAARNGKPFVSDVLVGRFSGAPVIIFAHPVTTSEGAFGGCVFLVVRMTTVQHFLNTLSGQDDGESYIVGRDGQMVSESSRLEQLRGQKGGEQGDARHVKIQSRLLHAALQDETLGTPYPSYYGETVVGAYGWINEDRWVLISEAPLSGVLHELYQFIWLITGIIIISLLLVTPFLVRFSHSLERPLSTLVAFARRIAAGEYDHECSLPEIERAPEEIQQLYNAFCDMNTKVTFTIEELERSAVVDQLTGVHNRRYLMSAGMQSVDQCLRSEVPCCCLMLDIDHFKIVNDTYGHAVGDMVLVVVARIIADSVRSSDIVARYGGEEFAVIAPNADNVKGMQLGERIRQAVAAEVFKAEGQTFGCTISIGVSGVVPETAAGGATLLERALDCADQQLYKAKRSGRNRVVTSNDC